MRFNVRGYNGTTKRPMAQSTSKISSKQFFNMAYMTRNANFENCNFLVYRKKNVKYWKALFSEVSSWNFVAECQWKRMKALSPSLPDTTAEFPQKPSWTSIKCTLLCNYGSLGMSSFCSRLTPSNLSLTLKEPNSQNEDANLTKVKLSRVRWANQDLCWREVSLTKWQNWVASTVADIKTSRLRWTDSPPNYLQHCKQIHLKRKQDLESDKLGFFSKLRFSRRHKRSWEGEVDLSEEIDVSMKCVLESFLAGQDPISQQTGNRRSFDDFILKHLFSNTKQPFNFRQFLSHDLNGLTDFNRSQ